MRRMLLPVVAMALLASAAARTQGQNTTDIYFIDTEGGQATLIISPVQRHPRDQGDAAAGRREPEPARVVMPSASLPR